MIRDIHTRLKQLGELVLELFAAHLAGALGHATPPCAPSLSKGRGRLGSMAGDPGPENLSWQWGFPQSLAFGDRGDDNDSARLASRRLSKWRVHISEFWVPHLEEMGEGTAVW